MRVYMLSHFLKDKKIDSEVGGIFIYPNKKKAQSVVDKCQENGHAKNLTVVTLNVTLVKPKVKRKVKKNA